MFVPWNTVQRLKKVWIQLSISQIITAATKRVDFAGVGLKTDFLCLIILTS